MATAIERKPLTEKQQAVFDWISDFIAQHGYSPTFRQIASAFGCATTNAFSQCTLIRKKGWITWDEKVNRTLRVTGGE
jgi:SOS-response transcriptional repressor LexA